MKTETPSIKVLMMPKDTNPHGIIFGGVLLSYIDQAGAVCAQTVADHYDENFLLDNIMLVTVAMDKIEFRHPVHVGDVVSLYAEPIKVGKSSITIQVEAHSVGIGRPKSIKVTTGTLVFVAVDENRKPVPVFEGYDPSLPWPWAGQLSPNPTKK